MHRFALYIHIPFCRPGKCLYCDFYSVPAEKGLISRYLGALERDLEQAPPEFAGAAVSSVFFGGGTPSLLEPAQVARLLEKVRATWTVEPGAEVSLEANPEDVDTQRARFWLEAGVNRLSVGCQSFDDGALKGLGRGHDSARAQAALAAARAAGFERLSADLILGGPGGSTLSVLSSIRTALELGANHLSIYGYHLEETCAARERPEFAECNEETYREQYMAACDCLTEAGWTHYEMSNWALRPGEACNHNLAYWTGRPYLGLGPSAHSYLPKDRRFWNRRDLTGYLAAMESGSQACREWESLDHAQVLQERLMLGLRLERGVPVSLVGEILGRATASSLHRIADGGLAVLENSRVRCTERGFLVFDSLVGYILEGGEFELDKKIFDCQN